MKASFEGVHPLLRRDRDGASFQVREMIHFLNGGEGKTKVKERMAELVEKDPTFASPEKKYFASREELIPSIWKKRTYGIKRIQELGLTEEEARIFLYYANLSSGFSSTHESMFIPTLANQTSEEQFKKWYPLAKNYQIIGTYAQTELGHGSNVRGLETTAIYDKKTKEFVLNSPTLNSTKWWPGGLGKISNFAILYARLIIDGKDLGIHGFIVQIRSLEDHSPLPGITLGDIGPKLGFNPVDNGFMSLDNVRIPLENMLAKYSSVSEDGVYRKPPHAKIGYGTMLFVRAYIVYEASDYLARACTIAIRYSAIRQQFPARGSTSSEEIPVLDYQTQQYRLLPLVATAFAFCFTGNYMLRLYYQMQQQLQNGDLSLLPLAHATTAGLKAITTSATSDGIEECRKCCGGHGYSQLSGLPDLFSNYVPACTFEGDNIVLLLQTASFVLKQINTDSFLPEIVDNQTIRLNPNCPKSQAQIFGLRAKRLAVHAALRLAESISKLGNENQAWDTMTVELTKMSRAYCYYTVVDNFVKALDSEGISSSLKAVLTRLCSLFALSNIEHDLGEFIQRGVLSAVEGEKVHHQILKLLKELRPDAVSLVDSFNFPDFLLNSSLGRFDGRAYESMLAIAKSNGLNTPENDPKLREAFVKHIKPFQQLPAKL